MRALVLRTTLELRLCVVMYLAMMQVASEAACKRKCILTIPSALTGGTPAATPTPVAAPTPSVPAPAPAPPCDAAIPGSCPQADRRASRPGSFEESLRRAEITRTDNADGGVTVSFEPANDVQDAETFMNQQGQHCEPNPGPCIKLQYQEEAVCKGSMDVLSGDDSAAIGAFLTALFAISVFVVLFATFSAGPDGWSDEVIMSTHVNNVYKSICVMVIKYIIFLGAFIAGMVGILGENGESFLETSGLLWVIALVMINAMFDCDRKLATVPTHTPTNIDGLYGLYHYLKTEVCPNKVRVLQAINNPNNEPSHTREMKIFPIGS